MIWKFHVWTNLIESDLATSSKAQENFARDWTFVVGTPYRSCSPWVFWGCFNGSFLPVWSSYVSSPAGTPYWSMKLTLLMTFIRLFLFPPLYWFQGQLREPITGPDRKIKMMCVCFWFQTLYWNSPAQCPQPRTVTFAKYLLDAELLLKRSAMWLGYKDGTGTPKKMQS